jgi:gamma-glutamyltranspeptidase / glutathione hydrolase
MTIATSDPENRSNRSPSRMVSGGALFFPSLDYGWPISTRRSTSYGHHGMVASASSSAAVAGLQTLAEGGNAFDAALTMAFVEGIALPWACGLGGDMFCVLYHAPTKRFLVICGSGAAPAAASIESYQRLGQHTMPTDGPLATSLPGALDAYVTLHKHFGSLSWERLVQPAIGLADDGVVVTPRLAMYLRTARDRLAQFPSSTAEFLPGGAAPSVGTVLRRPNLAQTLRRIVHTGRTDFYEGGLAQAIVKSSAAHHGLLSVDDFASHRTQIEEPIHTQFRGLDMYQPPLPSQGLIMLELLNILERFDTSGLDPLGDQAIHLIAEAKQLAFDDRNRWCGDPRFVDVPVSRLISKDHAAERASLIDPNRTHVPSGAVAGGESDTTFCAAIDGEGNAISLIHSLAGNWGSALVVEGTGILLNNRAGRGFSLDANDPNCLAPGKRTMNTLNCCMLARGREPTMMWGTPGGDLGLQWNVQTLLHVQDHHIAPQQALELPRWHSFPGTDPVLREQPPELQMEAGFASHVVQGLQARGHTVRTLAPWSAPSAMQVIAIDTRRGILMGASDPRAEGLALGC